MLSVAVGRKGLNTRFESTYISRKSCNVIALITRDSACRRCGRHGVGSNASSTQRCRSGNLCIIVSANLPCEAVASGSTLEQSSAWSAHPFRMLAHECFEIGIFAHRGLLSRRVRWLRRNLTLTRCSDATLANQMPAYPEGRERSVKQIT